MQIRIIVHAHYVGIPFTGQVAPDKDGKPSNHVPVPDTKRKLAKHHTMMGKIVDREKYYLKTQLT